MELKAQIDAFIAEKRNKNKNSAVDKADEEVVKMDVSTD